MTTNAGPEFGAAQAKYLTAKNTEEKIAYLEEMIRYAPKHKSSENMLAELKRRLAKLKKESEREKKTKKGGHSVGIKKEGDAQVTILGFPSSGKSTLLAALTNAKPKISEYAFTTTKPEIGTLDLGGLKIQMVELPPLTESEGDREWLGIARISDLAILLITSFDELARMAKYMAGEILIKKKLFVLNVKEDLSYRDIERLKMFPNLIKVSAKTQEGLENLKKRLFDNLNLIRVYTKEPGKKPSGLPIVIEKNSSIKEMAQKIRNDYPDRLISAKVWGNSAKFPGQVVGSEHKLEDKDIVELYLK